MKLYELTNSIRETLDAGDDGELTDAQLETLETLGIQLDEKIDGCCSLVREWEAMNAAKQAEIDRLRAGMDMKAGNVKRLKAYMQRCLESIGATKHETPIFKVRVQKNPPSCDLDGTIPAELLDKKYQRIKYEPDRKAAIEAYKADGIAPRGFVVTVGSHLRIM